EQPDLGTALLVVAAGGIGILLAGVNGKLVIGMAVAAVGAAAVVYQFFMHGYQRMRIEVFLNPEKYPLDGGWNIIQSKIAIGSGGLYGKGWLNGTQAQLEYLPERSTDFIFAVMGEEFGLFGVAVLLALYVVLVGRGLFIASQAQDTFTRLLAGSLSLTFFVYVFVNAGMVSGILPVVGVPLPFVSAGGTSMVTRMGGFGILAAIHGHRKVWRACEATRARAAAFRYCSARCCSARTRPPPSTWKPSNVRSGSSSSGWFRSTTSRERKSSTRSRTSRSTSGSSRRSPARPSAS